MKKLSILLSIIFLFSCGEKTPKINWEENKSFSEILESAGEKYVMIDFVKDG